MMLDNGYNVAAVDHDREALVEAGQVFSGRRSSAGAGTFLALHGDVSKEADVRQAIASATDRFGSLLSLTHSLAVSLGPDVRVHAISPGWIDVSGLKKSTLCRQEELSGEDHAQHPAGRVGRAGDIARMVLFLLDPDNSFMTGENIVIDGGMTRKMMYI